MTERISLTVFLTAAFLCGSFIIGFIWIEPSNESAFRVAPTLFIIGFFSFLVWSTQKVNQFYKIAKEK